jgi:heme/copper-type cytochrome/quinol oxidase subunit 2
MGIHSIQNPPASQSWIKRWRWLFLFIAASLLILFAPLPLPASVPIDRRIHIEASMFQFTPEEVAINPGDRVTVELVSTDVVHGFSLDGYNFDLQADPGQTASGTFIANRPGMFRFRCSVACGNLHPFMIGKLRIGPDLLLIRGTALGFIAVIAAIWSLRGSSGTIQVRPD